MTEKNTILLIEDKPADRELYKGWLAAGGTSYEVLESDNLVDGKALYHEKQPCCVVLDFILPDGDGLEFLMGLSRNGAEKLPIIFITGYGSHELLEDTRAMGAFKTINKNELSAESFCAAVDETLQYFTAAAA